jgi:long-chain acyl-CoA synthetase
MLKENLVRMYQESFRRNWAIPAFTDWEGPTLTYGAAAAKIKGLHAVFDALGIRRGDKAALLGKNSTNWAIAYLAAVTSGRVIVPILPDFHADDSGHIIDHSDSAVLFVGEQNRDELKPADLAKLKAVISLSDFTLLKSPGGGAGEAVRKALDAMRDASLEKDSFVLPEVANGELAAIIYTSGTTGFSKGVMLSHNSLTANVRYAREWMPLDPGDTIVSFLPLAHVFGCAFEFLFPVSSGCHITFLGRIPSPQVVMGAFGKIHPRLILSVPLVIEKIYHKQIKSLLKKGLVRALMRTPVFKSILRGVIRGKLTKAFGGSFREIVIGGAAFSPEVESFLRSIRFKFTVGYGMTECGPLISYCPWDVYRPRSCGRLVDTLELRIDSPDPANKPGEVLVRGDNVMNGYYRNEEATREALDADGWLHTGDLGTVDKDGFLYLKGRCKSMILGPSGQNIYPEEIETKLNAMPLVAESIALERDGQIVCLAHPDPDAVKARGLSDAEVAGIMERNREELNRQLPAFSLVAKIEVSAVEFSKTVTKKIKRFQYR